ncbi:MAG: glycosyltransferase family 4 protein [Pseudomonadota bacterium]
MHIVFLTDNFPPEGNAIASRVYERACHWITAGHEVTVITSVPNFPEGKVYDGYKNKFYQVEIMSGIRVVRIKTFIAKNKGFMLRTLDFLSYIVPALCAGLWQKKPDVIAATTPQFFVGVTAWLLTSLRRVPFVLEVADIWPASIVGVGAMQKSTLIKWLEKLELFLYSRANAIVVLTQAFKVNLTARQVPAAKISVCINGVETSQFSPVPKNHQLAQDLGIKPEQFVIGYLGTHGMAHGLANVLHSAEIVKDNPNILFLFAGAGAERDELMEYAKARELTNVKFIPAQPKKTMRQLWSLCNVALVHLKNNPVFAEVIPSKIFEAMGMGLPILLAAPAGEASAIITEENVGIWVWPENPHALAEAALRLYQNPELCKQYAEQSQQRAYFHSRERQANEMLSVLAATAHTNQNATENVT